MRLELGSLSGSSTKKITKLSRNEYVCLCYCGCLTLLRAREFAWGCACVHACICACICMSGVYMCVCVSRCVSGGTLPQLGQARGLCQGSGATVISREREGEAGRGAQRTWAFLLLWRSEWSCHVCNKICFKKENITILSVFLNPSL